MTMILSCVFLVFAIVVADQCTADIIKPNDCFTEDTAITLKSGQVIHGIKNTKNCTCEEAKAKRAPFAGMDWYVPTCDNKGQFKSKQVHGIWGNAWCVDANGNQVGEMVFGDNARDFTSEEEHLRGAAGRLQC